MKVYIYKNVVGIRLGNFLRFCFQKCNYMSLATPHKGPFDDALKNSVKKELEDFYKHALNSKIELLKKKDVLFIRQINNLGYLKEEEIIQFLKRDFQDNIDNVDSLLHSFTLDEFIYDLSDYDVLNMDISYINGEFVYSYLQDIYYFEITEQMIDASLSMESLFSRFYLDCYDFENLTLYKDDELFMAINHEEEFVVLHLNDEEYLEFQKHKIRHTTD